MNKGYEIQEELKSMNSILADISRSMPYSVPKGYFENFEGSVKGLITDLNIAYITPDWGKTLPYTVPCGYFEGLAQTIVAQSNLSELPKEAPFHVPAGYFESLPAQILAAAKATDNTAKEARIIPLKRRNIWKPIRLAAAAVLLLGTGFGSYRIIFNTEQASAPDNILASVPNNDIQDYLQHVYRIDIDAVVGNNSVNNLNLDNKDIIQYLNETGWD